MAPAAPDIAVTAFVHPYMVVWLHGGTRFVARPTSDDKGKVKFKIIEGRTIEFELDGFNSTIEESIKNIVTSLGRNNYATAPGRPALLQGRPPAAIPAADSSPVIDQEPITEQDQPEDEGAVPEAANGSASPRATQARKYTKPKFLTDIDLEGGDVSFKDFSSSKDLSSDNQKYMVIAAWFKKHHNLETISTAHFYTVFDSLSWPCQKDFTQPLRYLKKKNYFENPSTGEWKITLKGIKSAMEGPDKE
jgi:hypothetical protein